MTSKSNLVSNWERNKILSKLTDLLKGKDEIVFAYVHGSFLKGDFRDVDVAVYLKEARDVFYEIELETELQKKLHLPVDVRILNTSPLSFRFGVIKNGFLLFSKDESKRVDFEVLTISEYHDFLYFRKMYRREALGI